MAHAKVIAFRRPRLVEGTRLRLREAREEDAAFILSLRLDPGRNAFLSETPSDLGRQVAFLKACSADPLQIYFIIEHFDGRQFGTVRLYDAREESFEWGSWVLAEPRPPYVAIESTLLVYRYGLACGFQAVRGKVAKANRRLLAYHERYGAVRCDEDDGNIHFRMTRPEVERMLERFRAFLPSARLLF